MSRPWIFGAALMAVLLATGTAFGTLPLITDDTGTQGTGKFQVELGFEHQRLRGNGVSQQLNALTTILTGGVSQTVDVVCTIPVLDLTTRDIEGRTSWSGLGDISMEVK